jgi:putative drug exporter of the RND superfamily
LIHQFRWAIVVVWVVAALALAAIAPKPDRTVGEANDLLPADTPGHLALDELAKHFGGKSDVSSIVVVFERRLSVLTKQDLDQVERIALLIAQPQVDESIGGELSSVGIRSPGTLALAGKGNPLISGDGHAALIVISLPYNYASKPAARLVKHTQGIVAKQALPAGMSAAVTGSAGYGYDYSIALERSHQKTLIVTLVSVILILLLVYRAPIAAAIPLAAISLAAIAAFSLLGMLGRFGVHSGTAEEIFTFVLLYGAGVDYSLLFMSRYRELLDLGHKPAQAISAALSDSIPAIVSSAGMTMSGLAMLCFARFSVFRNAGPSVVLAVLVAAVAAGTLTPALLAVIGPRAFWPTHRRVPGQIASQRKIWPTVARLVVTRPGWIMVLTLAILLPPAVRGLQIPWSYDALFSLKSSYPARQGTEMVERHWAVGEVAPITVMAVARGSYDVDAWKGAASRMIADISAMPEVADIRALPQPLGSHTGAAENAAMLLLDRDKILAEFVSPDNQAMRLSVVLSVPPFSRAAMDAVPWIASAAAKAAVASKLDAHIDVTGATAETIDIRNITQQDFLRVAVLALAAILIVVTGVLRDPLTSIFIVGATVLSYLSTVGLTYWIFQSLGATGLESRVQMLLFMVLVAVGQDYSIFFAVRLAQEGRQWPPVEATQRALISTGPVISSCGLIMAATLGSVMAGDVQTLVQLGFAFALGMLIDTFLVRPLLLPAFVILTGRTLRRAVVGAHAPMAVGTDTSEPSAIL